MSQRLNPGTVYFFKFFKHINSPSHRQHQFLPINIYIIAVEKEKIVLFRKMGNPRLHLQQLQCFWIGRSVRKKEKFVFFFSTSLFFALC